MVTRTGSRIGSSVQSVQQDSSRADGADCHGSVISNEGWRNTQEAEITATIIPPSNDDEAAILATLVPGNYTAVVRGKNNTTGIAVVEAYNLQ
jgi:hypothetical protein